MNAWAFSRVRKLLFILKDYIIAHARVVRFNQVCLRLVMISMGGLDNQITSKRLNLFSPTA